MAVVGGLFFSMIFTLIMVPVVYTLLARFAPVRAKDAAEVAMPEVVPGGAMIEGARPK